MIPTPSDGPTIGDQLDAVTDSAARDFLTRCAAALCDVDSGHGDTMETRHAAAWLWRGLWSHPTRSPTLFDLHGLVSPYLLWPDPPTDSVPQK